MFAKGAQQKQSCTSGMVGGHGWGLCCLHGLVLPSQGRIVCQERRGLSQPVGIITDALAYFPGKQVMFMLPGSPMLSHAVTFHGL